MKKILLLGTLSLMLLSLIILSGCENITGEAAYTVLKVQNQTNQTGNLYVASNPTAANLYVDNVLKGTTPRTVTGLSVGNHAVKVTKSGYNDYSTTKYIYAGQTATLNVTLTRTNQTNSTY
jgi:hypothetical protein